MKHLFLYAIALLLMGYQPILSQGNHDVRRGERIAINLDSIPAQAFYQGKIQIKVRPAVEKYLQDSIIENSRSGYVETGHSQLDYLNHKYGIRSYKQMFAPLYMTGSRTLQYNERHRAWGFHLWFELEVDSDVDIISMVKEFEASPEVEIAEPVYKKQLIGNVVNGLNTENETSSRALNWTPNDPMFSTQWHYDNTGQQSGTPDADIDLPEAWEIETGKEEIIVAIVDGGIQYTHPDLAANMWPGIGYNFVTGSSTVTTHNHGTHVAGTVAAVTNNGTGVSGIAGGAGTGDGVRLMSCQVFTSSSSGGFHLAPVYAADNGAAISQNSWGYTNPNVYEQAVLDAIDYFNLYGGGDVMDGGITIFAAGNDNSSANWYPAYYSGSLSVAATNNQDKKANFGGGKGSNYGSWVDISAPGGETYQVSARGVRSTIGGSSYAYYQGTSMACPHVSGVAALLISFGYRNNEILSNTQVWDLLVNNVDDHYPVNPSYIGQLGSGRLNAELALLDLQAQLPVVLNPNNFTAAPVSSSQIDLDWDKNSNNEDVMIAWSPDGIFGTPENGITYTIGSSLPGGGTVLYRDNGTSMSHQSLDPGTIYYYKAFSYDDFDEYSSGRTANATTFCEAITSLPFSENFNSSNLLPPCWEIIDNQGNGQVWQFGTHADGLQGTTGNYAFLNSDSYGSGNTQNTDLISPLLDLTNYININLSFKHYFRQYQNVSTASLFYTTDNGDNWTQVQQWTSTTNNPASFAIALPQLNEQSEVQFKWNYTGTWGWYWDIDDIEITGDALEVYADFEANPTAAIVGETITLTDISGGVITSWNWEFGSGALPPGEITQGPHDVVYSSPGPKTITLTVNGTVSETKSAYLTILPCSVPSQLTVTDITTISAELGWSPGNVEQAWDLIWGLAYFDPQSQGTLISDIENNPYLLTDLEPGEEYDFYVRAVCPDENSDWAGPERFETQSLPQLFTVSGGGDYCENTMPTGVDVNLSGSELNVNYQLYQDGSPSGSTVEGTGSELVWEDKSEGIYTVNAMTSNGNVWMTGQAEITALPLPSLSCPDDDFVCIDSPSFELSDALPLGGVYSGTGVISGIFSPTFAGSGSHLITYTYTDGNGCSNSCAFNITVNDLPEVSCPDDFSLCLDEPAFSLSGAAPAGGTYSGNGVSNGVFSPAAAGVGSHEITYTYTDGNGCSNSCAFNIIVNDLSEVSCPDDFSLCLDEPAFSLSGAAPAGGTYSGNGVSNGVFFPAAAGVGSHEITYTYTDGNGCSNSCAFNITVNDLPEVSCPDDFSLCLDEPAFSLSGAAPAGGTYSGNGVSNGVFSPAAAGVGSHEITYTYTDGNGCSNSCAFNITVNDLPEVSCPDDFSLCLDEPAFSLSGAAPAGGTFSGNGVSNGVFSPAAAGVGSHEITYTYTDGNGCSNSCAFNITVNDLPEVSCPDDFSLCLDEPAFSLSGAAPAGGTFSGNGVSNGVFSPAAAGVGSHEITYTYADGNGCSNSCAFNITVNDLPEVSCLDDFSLCLDEPAFSLSGAAPAGGTYSGNGVSNGVFSPAAAGVGSHEITYTYADGNGCSNSCAFNITVNDLPEVSCPDDFSLCLDEPAFSLSGAAPAGGTYSGNGVSNGVFSPAAAGVGSHEITYTYTDGNGCSNSCAFNITVNDLPEVSCPDDFSLCLDEPAFSLSGAAPAGGTYSGNGVSNGVFSPAAAGVGSHEITYTYTDGNGCSNSCAFNITVNDLPEVSCPDDFSLCLDEPAFSLSGAAPAGGTFSGIGVNNGVFAPVAAGVGSHEITYTYADGNGCSNSCAFNITVNDLPEVSCLDDFSLCLDEPAFSLSGAAPAGGTYSGNGVSNGVFSPAAAGVGSHEITYTYTDGNGCSNSCAFNITANDLPEVSCPDDFNLCLDEPAFSLSGAAPAGGTFSGIGVNNGVFSPVAAGVGSHEITYTYTDGNGCSNSCAFNIIVNDLPEVSCPDDFSLCLDEPAFSLSGAAPAGGTYSGNGVSNKVFSPAAAGVGSHEITYTYTDGNGCSNSCAFNIIVNDLPLVFAGIDRTIPFGTSIVIDDAIASGSQPLVFSWEPAALLENPSVLNPTTLNLESLTVFNLIVTDVNGCMSSDGVTINIVGGPLTVDLIADPDELCLGEFTQLSANASGGSENYSYSWTSDPPGFSSSEANPVISPLETTIFQLEVHDGFNTVNDEVEVSVFEQPIVECINSFSVCINEPEFMLTGASPVGGNYSGNGVSNGFFDPVTAGVGTHQIIYSYTDANGCNSNCVFYIEVNNIPSVFAGIDQEIPYGTSTSINDATAGGVQPLVYNWTPANQLINPAALNPTTVNLENSIIFVLNVTDANGCFVSDQITITVTGGALELNPTAASSIICDGEQVQLFSNASGGSGNYIYSWTSDPAGFVSAEANPVVNPDTTTTFHLEVDDGFNQETSSITIIVIQEPQLSCPQDFEVHIDDNPLALDGAFPIGGTFSGTGVEEGIFYPSNAGIGAHTITYNYTDECGVFSCTFSILVESSSVFLPGDANCDGVVDVLDVITIINHILETNPVPFCFNNADLNEDDLIDILDVIEAINLILNNKKIKVNSSSASIYLHDDKISFESDGTLVALQFKLLGTATLILNQNLKDAGFEIAINRINSETSLVLFHPMNKIIPSGLIEVFDIKSEGYYQWSTVVAGNTNADHVEVNAFAVAETRASLKVIPNPTHQYISVDIFIPEKSDIRIALGDVSGRIINETETINLDSGMHSMPIEGSLDLQPGIYFIHLRVSPVDNSGDFINLTEKVVIVR